MRSNTGPTMAASRLLAKPYSSFRPTRQARCASPPTGVKTQSPSSLEKGPSTRCRRTSRPGVCSLRVVKLCVTPLKEMPTSAVMPVSVSASTRAWLHQGKKSG